MLLGSKLSCSNAAVALQVQGLQGDVLGRLALATTLGRAPGPWVQAQMRVIETEVERRMQQSSVGEASGEAAEGLPPQALLDVAHGVLLSGRQPQAELSAAAARVLPNHSLQLQVHSAANPLP